MERRMYATSKQLPISRKKTEAIVKKDSRKIKMNTKTMNTYINRSYAKKISENELMDISNKTWYLPHHPLFYPQKPKKVRLWFDAAVTFKEKSLNSELYNGPDLLNSLIGVLVRFQILRTQLVAEVKDMFHQVKVQKADMDSQWFLWMKELIPNAKLDTHQMTIYLKQLTHHIVQNYTLKSVARNNFSKFNSFTIESQ